MSGQLAFGALRVHPQPFESGIFGAPVWRVSVEGPVTVQDCDAVVAAGLEAGVVLCSCRVPADLPDSGALKAVGFVEVETLISFEGPVPKEGERPRNVRKAAVDDVPACRAIASEAFRFDRFHADRAVDGATAAQIKAQWIENDIRGRADFVFVAERAGSVCGFNACLLHDDRPDRRESGGPGARCRRASGAGCSRPLPGPCGTPARGDPGRQYGFDPAL